MPTNWSALPDAVTIADGSWSVQLRAIGCPLDSPAELANLTHPHLVEKLARDYLAAGAEVLTTNTFACNALVFERRGLTADPCEVARAGARIARRVAAGAKTVVGALGPSGRILAVREAGAERIAEVFAASAAALADEGVDAILLETFSELAELAEAIRAVKQRTNLPVIASMSFESGPQRSSTLMGVHAEQAPAALEAAGADVIGCNCGAGISTFLPTVVALRAHTQKPLWVKPNAGLPDLVDGRAAYSTTPDEFGQYVVDLLGAGANILGGCCGVGPDHIRRVAAMVEAWRRRHTIKKN